MTDAHTSDRPDLIRARGCLRTADVFLARSRQNLAASRQAKGDLRAGYRRASRFWLKRHRELSARGLDHLRAHLKGGQ